MKLIPFSRFIVNEESMEPAFKAQDHVLTFNWAVVKENDVVVFEYKNGLYLKRVKKVDGNIVSVDGDNKAKSAKIGLIQKDQIIGRVFLKY